MKHRGQIIQLVLKINASAKSLVEGLCEFKIYAISALSFNGSVCAPDKATFKTENHAIQCTAAGPCNALPSNPFRVGSVCGFGPDLVGIHSIILAARYRAAACSTTLGQGLEKIQTAREHNSTLFSLFHLSGREEFFAPSMDRRTANAFDVVCRLDRDGKLDEAPQNKKQNIAIGLFRDKLNEQDFAGLIAVRASEVPGPISRCQVADILPSMKLVSRASRPGHTVGTTHSLQWIMHSSKISH